MNVTINTDASFCPVTKVGGYAFWITSDLGRLKHYGTFDKCSSPQDAELKCLANAMYVLKNSHFNNGLIKIIYVNSDCKYMFDDILGNKKTPVAKYIFTKANEVLVNNKLPFGKKSKVRQRFKLRHVKAHTGNLTTKRSWVNDWCDRTAKEQMQSIRPKF